MITKIELENGKKKIEKTTGDQDNQISFYCDTNFSSSKARKQWIQYHACQMWIHKAYAVLLKMMLTPLNVISVFLCFYH